jgi:hypothetical protein
MRRETLVITVIVGLVLAPMWYVASHGESPSAETEIDQSVSEMRPLQGIVDTPNKLSPSQVGVIVWVALFALLAALAGVHRFMDRAVRPPGSADPEPGDGAAVASWFRSDDRWLAAYHDAVDSVEGVAVMGGLTVVAIVFAALFTGEYLTLARTQYFGAYAAGLFLSLALLTVSYYAWFLPHVEVAEQRGHKE